MNENLLKIRRLVDLLMISLRIECKQITLCAAQILSASRLVSPTATTAFYTNNNFTGLNINTNQAHKFVYILLLIRKNNIYIYIKKKSECIFSPEKKLVDEGVYAVTFAS